MNDLTKMQQLLSKTMNIYSDDVFIDMITELDVPEFWQELVLEELTDDECIYAISRLLSTYRDWNLA